MTEQALSGVRVLDLTEHIAGPFCAKLLADYGADVIKVERPGEGDIARRLGPFQGDDPHPEKSGLFLHLNTNKLGITLNLETATGQKLFKDLVREADLVVESFPPGTMARFGLGYEALEKINPRLVLASITPFGQTGPYKDYKASELVMEAIGSSLLLRGQPDREPLKYAGSVILFQGGLLAAGGVMAALFASQWQGVGQHVDISLLEELKGNYDMTVPALIAYQFCGEVSVRARSSSVADYPSGIYPCADGYIDIFGPAKFAANSAMIGHPELTKDPRFATPMARMKTGEDEFNQYFYPWLMERTKFEIWEKGLKAGCLLAPAMTIEDLSLNEHLRGRGYWASVDHPVMGQVEIPGRPFILGEGSWELRRPAPLLGEHNEEVYCGRLGLSREDLVKLRETGVI